MFALACIIVTALFANVRAVVVCGVAQRQMHARVCYETLAFPTCVTSSSSATFNELATVADARAVLSFELHSHGISADIQQECLYAWRIARCGSVFVPEARSRRPVPPLCASTCDELVDKCGSTLDVPCTVVDTSPDCSDDYTSLVEAACTAKAPDPPTVATVAPRAPAAPWRIFSSATRCTVPLALITALFAATLLCRVLA